MEGLRPSHPSMQSDFCVSTWKEIDLHQVLSFVPLLATEADDGERLQERCKSLEVQPVYMSAFLGRTPQIFHVNGKVWCV